MKAFLTVALNITTYHQGKPEECDIYCWIGSFINADMYCQNGVNGVRPELRTRSVTFGAFSEYLSSVFVWLPVD